MPKHVSILSGTLSDVLFGILIWHSYLAFFSGILSGIPSGILIWHSSLAFYLALYLTFYLAFYLAYLLAFFSLRRLRTGREHLAWILAVEVRQGTLGVDGRG